MSPELDEQILKDFYDNTISSYTRCIKADENSFLSDEIGISIFEVKPEIDSVRFKYTGMNHETAVIEVRLNLLSPDNLELGYFTSVFDEHYQEIGDFLVFI